jgi:hypothetical protein
MLALPSRARSGSRPCTNDGVLTVWPREILQTSPGRSAVACSQDRPLGGIYTLFDRDFVAGLSAAQRSLLVAVVDVLIRESVNLARIADVVGDLLEEQRRANSPITVRRRSLWHLQGAVAGYLLLADGTLSPEERLLLSRLGPMLRRHDHSWRHRSPRADANPGRSPPMSDEPSSPRRACPVAPEAGAASWCSRAARSRRPTSTMLFSWPSE